MIELFKQNEQDERKKNFFNKRNVNITVFLGKHALCDMNSMVTRYEVHGKTKDVHAYK